MVRVTQYKDY